jgi:hypothetical protein
MNVGICWDKNTIDPSGRDIEKPRKATLTFFNLCLNKVLRMFFSFTTNFIGNVWKKCKFPVTDFRKMARKIFLVAGEIFTIKTFLCNTQYYCIQLNVFKLQQTQKALLYPLQNH